MIFRDNDKDAWMRTKPMVKRNLYYVCRSTDTVKDLPYTENRANSISTLFYGSRREALIDLKALLTERVNTGICNIMQIERELANERTNKAT